MPERPIILTVFSDVEEPNPLEQLKEERKAILQILDKPSVKKHFERVYLPVDQVEDLLTFIQDHRKRIQVFHYGGHADKEQILLQKEKAFMQGIAGMFKGDENEKSVLKLVILNGCATWDMTDAFFDAGAKAVIATRAKIGDYAAKVFAKLFYRKLFDSRKSLQSAYWDGFHAVKSLSDQISIEKEAVMRGPQRNKINQLKAASPDPPWFLQISDVKILTEEFFPKKFSVMGGQASEEINAQRAAYIKAKEQEIEKKTTELAALTNKVATEKAILVVLQQNNAQLAAIKEEELQQLETQQKQLQDTLDQLKADLLKEDPQKQEDLKKLEEAFYEIDYLDQLTYFKVKSLNKHRPFQAFILQGSQECSIDLLVDLMLLDIHTNFRSKNVFVEIDFSIKGNEAPSQENIWKKVKSHLQVPADKSRKEVAELVLEYLKTQHVFFHFKRMNNNKADLNLGIIHHFWSAFMEEKKALSANTSFQHNCFLFASDEHCPSQDVEPFVLSRGYEQAIRKLLIAENEALEGDEPQLNAAYKTFLDTNHLHIVKAIQPILISTLNEWVLEKVPRAYRLVEPEKQQQLLDHDGTYGFVLSTIKNYCSQFKEDEVEIYNENFAKYEINQQG